MATNVRKQFGLEAALGHSNAKVTQIYAERDLAFVERKERKHGKSRRSRCHRSERPMTDDRMGFAPIGINTPFTAYNPYWLGIVDCTRPESQADNA